MVISSFISEDRNIRFVTYTLDAFQANIESFKKNERLNLDDSNFIDESNAFDYVLDGSSSYFLQLPLIDTIEFKQPIEYRRQFKLRKKAKKSQ